MTEEKFYISRDQSDQDGNVLWWKWNDLGYVSSLESAREFTAGEIIERQRKCPEAHRTKTAYNKELVLGIAVNARVHEDDISKIEGVMV